MTYLVGIAIVVVPEHREHGQAEFQRALRRCAPLSEPKVEISENGLHLQLKIEAESDTLAARRALYWTRRAAAKLRWYWRDPESEKVVVERVHA